ncbi:UvrD-helicase domain-containing protein [Salinibacter sp. 10B]|uniref:UvrD-helicase domain-containing protein n=1 Tax=Salinibacter sp. 10B TaxID=1923971 RepID=UPI000CF4067B|nr:UvrD-helicase domain-containing protein [Salinibacter sp. 10B]
MKATSLQDQSERYDDAAVRRRIGPWDEDGVPDLDAFDPDTNFVVTAAAGSGKTTALVARMVALVRQGVPVRDLTAITFTRKAAGEMSTRFFKELQEARVVLPDGSAQHERVTRALGSVQSAFIGTIHSFCARLLRERPLAAGLPPDFTAGLEDREERQLRDRAWQQHLSRVHEDSPERIERIAEYGLDPQDLTAFFERLCAYPELSPLVDAPDEPPALDAAVAAARERLREWDARRPDTLPKGEDDVMAAFDTARRMLRYRDLDAPAEKAEFLSLFSDVSDAERADVKITYWKGDQVDNKDWARSLRDDLLPSFIETTVQPVLRDWEALVHEAVVDFTQPAVERYRELRREEGLLTFHDLLSHTRDLLRDHPDVRRTIQERYPILLVDEFQDTDPLQAEILSFLASQDPMERTWDACRPRDGSLFIVGDDKQSIYRFRRADKGVFDAFRTRIDDEPNGEAVTLTKNFRSRTPICEWCNDAFGAIFDDPNLRDLQAEYVPFDPQRAAGPEGTALRRNPLDKVGWNRGRQIAEQDATRIARFIQAARAGDAESDFYRDEEGAVFEDEVNFSDFLILTRAKTRLGVYTDVLARYGIPYTVTGSEDLGDSDELKAVVDLLRAALRPDDPIAAVAYLKGALAGWSDDDLYRFRRAGGDFGQMDEPVPDAVWEALDDDRTDRIEGAFDRVRHARSVVLSERPSVGIEQIVDAFGLLAGAAHPDDPAEASMRAGAVLRITSYVQHLGAQGLGWGEVVEELDLILEGEESVDGMTLETGGGDAVRVMNVHQAKGLEAPVVFLADPYSSGSAPKPTLHLRRKENEIVAPVVQGEGYFTRITHAPLGWHDDTQASYRGEEERHEAAEEHRLLYVAATRAERLLVVSTYPEKPNDGPWAPLYEPLQAADVPALAVPEGKPPIPPRAPAPDLEEHRTRRTERIATQSHPSYTYTFVTDEKEGGALLRAEAGYGREFGTAMHRLFEQVVRHRLTPLEVSDDVLQHVLEQEDAEVTEATVRRLRSMLVAFQESWIWEELQAASELHTEHPFARQMTDSEGGESSEQILRGDIDLLYRRDDTWTLVDFKSDRVDDAEGLATALGPNHKYRRQVRAYVEAWTDVTGEPVGTSGLWFADAGTFVSDAGAGAA